MKNKHHMTETVTKTLYKKIPRRGIWKHLMHLTNRLEKIRNYSITPLNLEYI